jgi:hypothetical protein
MQKKIRRFLSVTCVGIFMGGVTLSASAPAAHATEELPNCLGKTSQPASTCANFTCPESGTCAASIDTSRKYYSCCEALVKRNWLIEVKTCKYTATVEGRTCAATGPSCERAVGYTSAGQECRPNDGY